MNIKLPHVVLLLIGVAILAVGGILLFNLQAPPPEPTQGPSQPPQWSPPTQPPAPKYVGSINSNIYHYPSCKWAKKIYPQNEIWFSSPSDAKVHGYRPCKVCRPP